MVTTFERLAKVLKGYIKPANWIERAFASIAGALVPSYTAEDNDKVLTVKNNALSWEEGGGGSPLVVSYEYNTTTGKAMMDKTYAEIEAAVKAGTVVFDGTDLYTGEYPSITNACIIRQNSYTLEYELDIGNEVSFVTFRCQSKTDYPVYSNE